MSDSLRTPPPFRGSYHESDGFFLIATNADFLRYLDDYRNGREWDEIPGVTYWEDRNGSFYKIDFDRFRDRYSNAQMGAFANPVFIGWIPVSDELAMLMKLVMEPE